MDAETRARQAVAYAALKDGRLSEGRRPGASLARAQRDQRRTGALLGVFTQRGQTSHEGWEGFEGLKGVGSGGLFEERRGIGIPPRQAEALNLAPPKGKF